MPKKLQHDQDYDEVLDELEEDLVEDIGGETDLDEIEIVDDSLPDGYVLDIVSGTKHLEGY